MSIDARPGATSASPRRRLLLAAALLSAVSLSGCAVAAEDDVGTDSRAPYAAVATDASGDAGVPSSSASAAGGATMLDRGEMQEVLLGEGEFPFTADEIVQHTGVEYFEESIGITGDVYRRSFGDGACAQQMDTVNERLVGEDPVDGVFRKATVTDDVGTHTLYVWMLAYERPAAGGAVWDEVMAACDGTTLEGAHDAVSFAALAPGPFRGLSLSIDDGGSASAEPSAESTGGTVSSRVDGFSVTADVGRHLVSISSVGLSREAFDQAVEVQQAALEDHPDLAG